MGKTIRKAINKGLGRKEGTKKEDSCGGQFNSDLTPSDPPKPIDVFKCWDEFETKRSGGRG